MLNPCKNYHFQCTEERHTFRQSWQPSQAPKRITCRAFRKAVSDGQHSREEFLLKLVSAVAVGLTALAPPSIAEIQTVNAQEATSLAKPLKSQPVKKNEIWGLFLLGAFGLFGGAVALERNSTFFPAIARANQAIAATREAQKKREAEEKEAKEKEAIEVRSEEAVLDGLADARAKVASSSEDRRIENGSTASTSESQNQQIADSQSGTSSESEVSDESMHKTNQKSSKQPETNSDPQKVT